METVSFGNHVGIPVVAQRHARLRHRLSYDDFQKILSKDYDTESYKVLCILIPALETTMPVWEWSGYVSEEAMMAGEYDEATDPSPTTDQIVNGFETALTVSGAGRLGKVIGLAQSMVGLIPTQTPPSPDLPGSIGA